MTKRLAAALSLVAVLVAPLPAPAAKPVAPAEPIVQPMRVAVVQLADPACGDSCPRWISAEGELTHDTPALVRDALKRTAKDAPPVFIHSNGGSIDAALAIGRMLRQAGRDVAVTATRFDGCAPGDPGCRPKDGVYRGYPVSYGAFCLSACPYLIAGGKRRFISVTALVGVHRIQMSRTLVKTQVRVAYKLVDGKKVETSRTEIARTVAGERTSSPDLYAAPYDRIRAYLAEMGVAPELVTLSYIATHDAMHALSRAELRRTQLMTDPAGGERRVGRPTPGFEEGTLPPAKVAAKQPYADWLAAVLKRKGRLPRAALQVRVGGRNAPLFVLFDFVPDADARTVVWRAWLLRDGEYVNSDYATVALQADGVAVIAPTMLESSIVPGRSHAGQVSVADFCRLAGPGPVTVTLKPLAAKGGPDLLAARRESAPWVDRTLLDRCDPPPAAPATTAAARP
jgi:hypothetical protein